MTDLLARRAQQTSIAAPTVLIDAGNLRVGGGVQVAASFIDDLVTLKSRGPEHSPRWLEGAVVEATEEVVANLTPATRRDSSIQTIGSKTFWSPRSWRSFGRRYDVSFTIFGPAYGTARARRRVTGFADVTTAYSRPLGVPAPGVKVGLKRVLRGAISRWLFSQQDVLVVETPALAERLQSTRMRRTRIEVVSNTYNRIFDHPESWWPLQQPLVPGREDEFLLAYVTRAYPHKNLAFLGLLGAEYGRYCGSKIRFAVTLTPSEWQRQSAEFRRACVNFGALNIHEVPALYESCDGAIFPSLLEGFSAMPLEAMKMNKVLFASDRSFVRSTCGSAPVYIDPLDPLTAARTLAATLNSRSAVAEHVAAGRALVDGLPTSLDRTHAYLRLIDEQVHATYGVRA